MQARGGGSVGVLVVWGGVVARGVLVWCARCWGYHRQLVLVAQGGALVLAGCAGWWIVARGGCGRCPSGGAGSRLRALVDRLRLGGARTWAGVVASGWWRARSWGGSGLPPSVWCRTGARSLREPGSRWIALGVRCVASNRKGEGGRPCCVWAAGLRKMRGAGGIGVYGLLALC